MNLSQHSLPYAVVAPLNSVGLQAARLLAGQGVPVIGITDSATFPLARTRVCERVITAENVAGGFIKALLALGPSLEQKAVLFPANDYYVYLLSRHREELQVWFHIVLPDEDTVELLLNKARFYIFAAEQGFDVPKSIIVENEEDLQVALETMSFPCFVKPASSKDAAWREAIGDGAKGVKASSAEDLQALFARVSAYVNLVIVQEWIEGPDDELISCKCYIDQFHEMTAVFVNRKLRQNPPRMGVGVLVEPWQDDIVVETTADFLRTIEFWGMAAFEFKVDQATGRRVLLDPNFGRLALTGPAAAANGVPLLYSQYCEVSGLPLPEKQSSPPEKRVKWVYAWPFFRVTWQEWIDGDLSLRAWWRLWRGKKVYAIWSWQDPKPFAYYLWNYARPHFSMMFRESMLRIAKGPRKASAE